MALLGVREWRCYWPGRAARQAASQLQVQPERIVQLRHVLRRHPAQDWSETFDAHGPDLLGLRLGVDVQAGQAVRQQHLERKDAGGAAGDGHDGDDALAVTAG